MCKDAHVQMFQEMTKNQLDQLGKSEKGREFLGKVGAVPILMVQIHTRNMRIDIVS